MATSIIIDTDPGQDDAIALLLAFAAHEDLDLRLITTVAGNVSVAQTTANALRVRDLAGRGHVPVHRGADGPLLFPLETAEFVCGPDGLAGAGLPATAGDPAPGHAVQAIIAALRSAPADGLTLCALGPLTNLALAFRLAPDILPKIRRIVLMGGALGLGNMTPAAEFNIYVDPHAAAIVFGCGRPIVMLGLGVTLQAIATPAQVAGFASMGTKSGRAIHGMLTRPRPGGLGTDGHPMHDPCVIAWLLWPELFGGRDCHVTVETGDGPLRGRTTIDWNGRLSRPANAYVIGTVDAVVLFDRMAALIATLPRRGISRTTAMPHFVDDLQQQADAAIARMRAAALEARHVHARAELMRHMLTTARKVKDAPRPEAIDTIVSEWMAAWNLDRGEWHQVAREMEAFTAAFLDYSNDPSDDADRHLRASCASLDAALAQQATTISDQMAWRSQCAHRWWELVTPAPPTLAGAKPRPDIPELDASAPFWATGCAGFCN